MSKIQLRSKRRLTSPSNRNSCSNSDEILAVKKPKKKTKNESDTESSSDEFERPSDDLKMSVASIASKNGSSPALDFSSIEKSIFSEVSRLSDSDSNGSDFEEIIDIPSVNSSGLKDSQRTVDELVSLKAEAKSEDKHKEAKRTRGRLDPKSKLKIVKTGNDDVAGSSQTNLRDDNKNTGRATRSSKTKMQQKVEEVHTNSSRSVLCNEETVEGNKNKRSRKESLKSSAPCQNPSKPRNHKPEPSTIKVEIKEKHNAVSGVKTESVDNLDIAQLLALGEGLISDTKTLESDSESEDWEEVDVSDVKKHEIPKEGVQITLDMPEFSWRRKKQQDQQACLEAEMNRAFNRVRRQLQLLCHQTSLLLWIAHGISINRAINSESVRAMALSLVPVNLCTLPKAPERKHFDKILQWFLKDFECSEGFPETTSKNQPRPLASALEQHFSRRYAKSTKELTFMFIAVLRAIGMESRLIVSFQPIPLKPQSDELLSINSKSKRGRVSKKDLDDAMADDPDEPGQASGSAKLRKSTSSVKKHSKLLVDSEPDKKENSSSSKPSRKSAPAASMRDSKKATSTKSEGGKRNKLEPTSSPSKSRILRGKSSKKSYKEQTDSEQKSSDEDNSQPILSPEKKRKIDENTAERLKAAAAKRTPTNRRFAVKKSEEPTSSKYFKSEENVESKHKGRSVPTKESPVKRHSSSHKPKSEKSSYDSDSDFEVKPKTLTGSRCQKVSTPKKGQSGKHSQSKKKDDDSGKKQLTSSGSDYWVEVYFQDEERWVCIDVPSKKIDSTKEILAKATQPIRYVVAYNPDGTVKDVTKRYAPKFSQVTCKLRVSSEWWDKTLKPFRPKHSKKEAAEDSEMNLVELDRPMPKSVGECKNHPLYVLKRHLLKFEAIYPPDSPSLGFVRNEAIYARQNVYTLHSREIWMKDAKVVRPGQEPYKIVKARPKYDRHSGKVITDLPLEIFGPWQVEDYVPPPAVDGKVPRNAYGNVELFKPTMLPKGCVHLQVPGLTRVAKKLRIDCAPAVVGFDYHSGGCHPTYDGFVVCEEYVDVLMDAWNKEIDESAKRREEKHEKRVYGNWRRLIKGLLIREALKYRYDFKGEAEDEGSSQPSVSIEALKASRITPENAPLPSLFPKLMANIRAQKKHQRRSSVKEGKKEPKRKNGRQKPQAKSTARRKRKNETSEEEEESDWDSSSTDEDDSEMILLSDEDSASDFEDLKK